MEREDVTITRISKCEVFLFTISGEVLAAEGELNLSGLSRLLR